MPSTSSDVAAPDVEADSPVGSTVPAPTWWMRLMFAIPVIILAAFVVIATAVPAIQVRQLSILDEAAHIDSVFRVPSIDRSGEKFLPETLDQVSCRGGVQQWPDWHPAGCGLPQESPPADYQIGSGGYNTADIHPPTYYFLTAAISTVGGWFVTADQVTLMRLTGSLYLAIGVCLTWLLARRLGANRWAAFGAAGVLATAPNVLYMSSIVNVDASVIMASAAFGLAVTAVWRRRSAWWLLPLLAIALMLVKMTNLGALIAMGLFILVTAALEPLRTRTAVPVESGPGELTAPRSPQEREIAGPAAVLARWRVGIGTWWSANGHQTLRALGLVTAMGLGAVVVTLGWSRIQNYRALIPASELWFTQQFKVERLAFSNIGESLLRFWDPTGMWFPLLSGRPYLGIPLLMITAAVPVGLLVASWFRDRRVFPMLMAALTTMVIAAPIYVVMNFVVNGVYFNPDFRYGLSVLPFFAAAVGAGLRTRLAGGVLAVLAVVGMLTTLAAL